MFLRRSLRPFSPLGQLRQIYFRSTSSTSEFSDIIKQLQQEDDLESGSEELETTVDNRFPEYSARFDGRLNDDDREVWSPILSNDRKYRKNMQERQRKYTVGQIKKSNRLQPDGSIRKEPMKDYLPRLGSLTDDSDMNEDFGDDQDMELESRPEFNPHDPLYGDRAQELRETVRNSRQSLPPHEHDALQQDAKYMYQILVKTGRHCKVTAGGRIFSSSVLLLLGTGDGIGGLGYGKGPSYTEALNNAVRDAKKNLITINRVDESLSYQTKEKYCRARVYVWPLAKNSGIHCSFRMQEVCNLFGLTDVRIKTFGRRNPHNIYRALLNCFKTSETPEMLAKRRGKKVWDINKYWRVNNRSKAY